MALRFTPGQTLDSPVGKFVTTAALLLSVVVLLAIVDAFLIRRTAKKAGAPPKVPKLAMDVLRVAILAGVAFYAATEILDYPVTHILVSS